MNEWPYRLLFFYHQHDLEGELEWGYDQILDITSPIFQVRCNDVFWWGTSDSEDLREEDLPLLEKSFDDVRDVLEGEGLSYSTRQDALILYCARKREMRPQGAAYPKDKRLWPLFDACGDARPIDMGNPKKRPGEEVEES